MKTEGLVTTAIHCCVAKSGSLRRELINPLEEPLSSQELFPIISTLLLMNTQKQTAFSYQNISFLYKAFQGYEYSMLENKKFCKIPTLSWSVCHDPMVVFINPIATKCLYYILCFQAESMNKLDPWHHSS